MTAKELLKERIDELSGRLEEISEEEAVDWLFALDDLTNAEPEPLTAEEIAHLREGIAQLDAGQSVPDDEVLRRFGISR